MLMRKKLVRMRRTTGRTKTVLNVMSYYLRLLFRLILLVKVRTATSLLRRLRFLIKVLSTLNMMDTILIRVAARMRTRVEDSNYGIRRRTLPNTVLRMLIINYTIRLLSITISTRLIRRINGNHRRVKRTTSNSGINNGAVNVADLYRRKLYLLQVVNGVVRTIIMNDKAKGYPLIDRLYRTRRRYYISNVRVSNMTRNTTSANVNPKTIGNAIKSRARALSARTILIVFLSMSTYAIRLLRSNKVNRACPMRVMLINLRDDIYNTKLDSGNRLRKVRVKRTLLPMVLILNMSNMNIILRLTRLRKTNTTNNNVRTTKILRYLKTRMMSRRTREFRHKKIKLYRRRLSINIVGSLAKDSIYNLNAIINLVLLSITLSNLYVRELAINRVSTLPRDPNGTRLVNIRVPLHYRVKSRVTLNVVTNRTFVEGHRMMGNHITNNAKNMAKNNGKTKVTRTRNATYLKLANYCYANDDKTDHTNYNKAKETTTYNRYRNHYEGTRDLRRIPAESAFRDNFSFLSFLFLHSSTQFYIYHTFIMFDLARQRLFRLPGGQGWFFVFHIPIPETTTFFRISSLYFSFSRISSIRGVGAKPISRPYLFRYSTFDRLSGTLYFT